MLGSSPFSTLPLGAGPWLPSGGSATLVSAIGRNRVLLILPDTVRQIDPLVTSDALNPYNYQLQSIAGAAVPDIAFVEPGDAADRVFIRCSPPLLDSQYYALRIVSQIAKVGGGYVPPSLAGTFDALPVLVNRSDRSGDIRTTMSQASEGGDWTLGGIDTDKGGDYALSDRSETLKKRMLRRLLTSPGELVGDATYGVGLRGWKGRLGGVTRQAELASAIKTQMLLEPEVTSCEVSFYERREDKILVIRMKAQTQGGPPETVETPFDWRE